MKTVIADLIAPNKCALRWTFGFFLGLLLTGCENLLSVSSESAQRPDLDLRTTAPGDLIRFQPLSSTDFGSALEPESPTPDSLSLGLHASLSVLVSPYATLGFRPLENTAEDGEQQIELLAKDVYYAAVLDRRHSWLKPELEPEQRAYALSHAYIHFALYEAAARRLTQAANDLLEQGYRGQQPLVLVKRFTDDMARRIEQELKRVAQQARQFDQESLPTLDPKVHGIWINTLHKELADSEALSYATHMQKNYPGVLEQRIQGLRFTQAGLYDPGPCAGMVLKLQSLGHFGCVSPEPPKFLRGLNRIPLRKGVTFGVEFTPKNLAENQWAELDVVTVYPEPGVRPPGAKQNYSTNLAPILVVGKNTNSANLYLYQLAEDWELIPGVWRFEFYSHGQKIAEQAFELFPTNES